MGLNFFGWRYYDAIIRYWISQDPEEQFWSGYNYIGNGINPIIGSDPNGKRINKKGIYGTKYLFGNRESKAQREYRRKVQNATYQYQAGFIANTMKAIVIANTLSIGVEKVFNTPIQGMIHGQTVTLSQALQICKQTMFFTGQGVIHGTQITYLQYLGIQALKTGIGIGNLVYFSTINISNFIANNPQLAETTMNIINGIVTGSTDTPEGQVIQALKPVVEDVIVPKIEEAFENDENDEKNN